MNKQMVKVWKENKQFIIFLVLMFVFRSAVADWNHVPSGSMLPNIVVGDRLLVNKMAYDVRVPFTHISLYRHSHPEAGDIVIFDSAASGIRLVKRVIGVPGDVVEMRGNRLIINGQPLSYETDTTLDQEHVRERLGQRHHMIRLSPRQSRASSFLPVKVPEDAYLVLGDNRDNSADSRFIGFVPRDEIVGRTRSVVMSFDHDNYFIPRRERFFYKL